MHCVERLHTLSESRDVILYNHSTMAPVADAAAAAAASLQTFREI